MSDMHRRQWLGALAGAGAASLVASSNQAAEKHSSVRAENTNSAGTDDWQLTYTRIDPKSKSTRFGGFGGRSTMIEGYCSRQSVRAGDKLEFFVSTDPPSDFFIEIYRLGYYQGKGGRLVERLGPLPGKTQATPAVREERLRDCQWEASAGITIPDKWLSGVYLAKLSAARHRYQSYMIFIVRDDRPADFVFQCCDNTWQAYNTWPDNYSLYINDRKDNKILVSGVKVSFNRPYARYSQILDFPLSQGSGEFLLWEFPLAYWMEKEGYDVTYVSNADVAADVKTLTRAKAFLSVGHDEYWDRAQYDHVKQAIEAGVNAAFLSGNTCCFVAPFSASQRVLTRAGRYGGIRPKEQPFMADLPAEAPNEATIIGAQTVTPFNGSGDWIVTKPEHWIFAGTGMKKGDRIPGLVGWEFHGEPAAIPGLEVVAEGPTWTGGDAESHYTATIYPGPKGNFVFNAATIFWAQGLSQPPGHMPPISHHGRPHGPDERVQRITKNVFDRFQS
ncbi:MAG TPA: N,N-dimethylformamidase beta subunit family domain-containing protein [Gemmataceae bacterium]|nr:N,N-dimethylformamidase beta subunit family domain-containing protein [Gemmataceae bacterium]